MLVQVKGAIEFQPPKEAVAVRAPITLINTTSTEQTVHSDDNQTVYLKPYKGIGTLSFNQPGQHMLSLANDASIYVFINVVETKNQHYSGKR